MPSVPSDAPWTTRITARPTAATSATGRNFPEIRSLSFGWQANNELPPPQETKRYQYLRGRQEFHPSIMLAVATDESTERIMPTCTL